MTSPSVTIAMAVHNGMPFVEESVRSILAQSFRDFEFVIGDDGSDDGTSEVLERLASDDPRIRLLRRQSKSGLAASGNWVVGEARAPLVAIAHADDRAWPQRIERQVLAFEEEPSAVLVGTLCEGIDERGRSVRPADLWRLTHHSPFAPFAHSSIMFRRDRFIEAGGYRSEAEYWEDLDLYFRLAELGRILVVPEVLTSVRHARTSTRLRDDRERVENAVDLMFRAADAYARGQDHEAVIRRPRSGARKLHPRTYISRGSTRLWSGRPPRVLGRMLRRGDLRLDLASLQALVWAAWGEVSPRTLRLFIRTVLNLRNRAEGKGVRAKAVLEWRPRK